MIRSSLRLLSTERCLSRFDGFVDLVGTPGKYTLIVNAAGVSFRHELRSYLEKPMASLLVLKVYDEMSYPEVYARRDPHSVLFISSRIPHFERGWFPVREVCLRVFPGQHGHLKL